MAKRVDSDFTVRVWGARGSVSGSRAVWAKYGGNTSCIEVRCGKRILIFDAGSGLLSLGRKMIDQKELRADLFFSHCHYDHICGLPFFLPLHNAEAGIDIWSGHLPGPNKTKKMCESYMRGPFFPVGPEIFAADVSYRDFEAGDLLRLDKKISLRTIDLPHHNGCIGYRVEFGGRAFCYMTDLFHIEGEPDLRLREFVRGSDLMIYDATYTDEEFPKFAHFGHSTWQEGMRICQDAEVKRYCIFHHYPGRTDDMLDDILKRARAQFPATDAAYEGLEFSL